MSHADLEWCLVISRKQKRKENFLTDAVLLYILNEISRNYNYKILSCIITPFQGLKNKWR